MNTKNIRLLLIVSIIALAFGLGTIASQFLPPDFWDNLTLSSMFLPIIQKAPDANGPSGTLHVFATVGKVNPFGLGRSGMNAICLEEDPSSHFCTLSEIENAFQTSGVFFDNSFAIEGGPESLAWLDNPSVAVNNWVTANTTCAGWTVSDPSELGTTIMDKAFNISNHFCNKSLSVACCKWIP